MATKTIDRDRKKGDFLKLIARQQPWRRRRPSSLTLPVTAASSAPRRALSNTMTNTIY